MVRPDGRTGTVAERLLGSTGDRAGDTPPPCTAVLAGSFRCRERRVARRRRLLTPLAALRAAHRLTAQTGDA